MPSRPAGAGRRSEKASAKTTDSFESPAQGRAASASSRRTLPPDRIQMHRTRVCRVERAVPAVLPGPRVALVAAPRHRGQAACSSACSPSIILGGGNEETESASADA
eukprot:722974-Prymnesium_polylepis.1